MNSLLQSQQLYNISLQNAISPDMNAIFVKLKLFRFDETVRKESI